MQLKLPYRFLNHPERLLLLLLTIEWLMMVISGFDPIGLSAPPLYSPIFDPVYGLIFGLKIPQSLTGSHSLSIFFEVMIFFGLIGLIRNPNSRIVFPLWLILVIHYVLITGYLGHRNFQSGFLVILIPFMFKDYINRTFVFEAIRYYILIFYCTAGIYKLLDTGWLNPEHMSKLIERQMMPYLFERQYSIRLSFNNWLIHHKNISQCLFISGMLVECLLFVGFFTKRFDKYLGCAILSFHVLNWWIMDISVLGQISLISLLLIGNRFFEKKF